MKVHCSYCDFCGRPASHDVVTFHRLEKQDNGCYASLPRRTHLHIKLCHLCATALERKLIDLTKGGIR